MGKTKSFWGEANKELRRELHAKLDQQEIRRLHTRRPMKHLLVALRQFFFLGLSTWLLVTVNNPLLVVPAALLSGFTVFNFTVLLHEQLHNLVFAGYHPRLNAVLGWFYAFWSGISASQFTRWHLDHHVQLGSDIKDPKRHHLSPKVNSRLLKLSYFTPILFFLYFRAAARESASYKPALRSRIAWERTVSIGGHIALQLSLFLLVGGGAWLRAYAVPVFLVFPVAFAVNRIGQHYNIKEDDPAGWATWVRGHWFWDFLFLNSNYHLEHHYYPGIPFYNLPCLQRMLEPVYRAHELVPHSYPDLLYGYLVDNGEPHRDWDFV
jgi:beta-carotene hydroxylase